MKFLQAEHCLAASALQLSLKDAFAMVGQSAHSKMVLSRFGIEEAEQDVNEIFGTFYSPRFSLESYTGLVSEARGDITTTTDTNDSYDSLGPFFKIDLKVIQPIYSFGKYTRAKEAGESYLAMRKAMYLDTKNDLTLEVAKAYLGTVAGRDGIRVGEELRDQYQQLVAELEKSVGQPDAGFDDSDLFEAKSMLYEIEKQRTAIAAETEQALIYLKGLLDLERDMEITARAADIPVLAERDELTLGLQQYFRDNSPLLRSLDSGLKALKMKAELERQKKYPDLFVALGAGYGSASNRDEQDNAFVKDDYNYQRLGGVLGLNWDFNYHVNSAKVEKSLIEYLRLVTKRELTLLSTDGSIEKLCGEAARNQKLLEAAISSLAFAKSWLRVEGDNRDLGIGDIKRMVRAYQQYFQLKGEVVAARHRYLVSLAELANAAGNTDLLLRWIEDGKVLL